MRESIELRLKFRRWLKKYGKFLFVIIIVWSIIFLINKFLKDYQIDPVPNTTYTPKVSVLDTTKTVPNKVQSIVETKIEEYVQACNEGKYQKAFGYISEECRKYEFDNDIEQFSKYILNKMPTPKKYSIQSYSIYNKCYIYEVKYFDDLLATGLTDSEYQYTTEKISLKKNSDGDYDMSVGNFIAYEEIKNISENEYLKIDVKNKLVRYSTEVYEVKFTNRTEDIIVIADNFQEVEVALVLSDEYRKMENVDAPIIIYPGTSQTVYLGFMKFVDDNDPAQSILFGNIRVLEEYSGSTATNEEKQADIDKAVAKFSVSIPVSQ